MPNIIVTVKQAFDPEAPLSVFKIHPGTKRAPGLAIWELARGGLGPKAHDIYGRACSDYHLWQRKTKRAFDPNVASDPNFYIEP